MEAVQVKIPKIVLDKILSEGDNFDVKSIGLRLSNDVFNTEHKKTAMLESSNCLKSYSEDKGKAVLDLDWSNISEDLQTFAINVSMLEVLLDGKVVSRQCLVIGKDLTLNKWRAEAVE